MKRYDIDQEEEQWAEMREDPEGDWVKFEEAEQRIKELESDLGNTERCEEAQIQRADKAELHIAELEDSLAAAKREAENLANTLYKNHYKKDSPRFELCDSVAGVISQLDNMTTGLVKRPTAQSLAAIQREAIETMIKTVYGYSIVNGYDHDWVMDTDDIKEYAKQLTDNA